MYLPGAASFQYQSRIIVILDFSITLLFRKKTVTLFLFDCKLISVKAIDYHKNSCLKQRKRNIIHLMENKRQSKIKFFCNYGQQIMRDNSNIIEIRTSFLSIAKLIFKKKFSILNKISKVMVVQFSIILPSKFFNQKWYTVIVSFALKDHVPREILS